MSNESCFAWYQGQAASESQASRQSQQRGPPLPVPPHEEGAAASLLEIGPFRSLGHPGFRRQSTGSLGAVSHSELPIWLFWLSNICFALKESNSSLHTICAYQGKFLPPDYQRRYSPGNFFVSSALYWSCACLAYAHVVTDDLTMGDCFNDPGYLNQDIKAFAEVSVRHATHAYLWMTEKPKF